MKKHLFKPTVCWSGGAVKMIDQTLLPGSCKTLVCRDTKQLWSAIRRLSVRGAPALGIAAAYGVLLGAKEYRGRSTDGLIRHIHKTCDYLSTSRPTAVNLFHSIEQMRSLAQQSAAQTPAAILRAMKQKADEIYEHDRTVCRRIGRHGATIIRDGGRYITVCNAGALATADYGTALGVFYAAMEEGKSFHVYACETRPLLQGARLTTWELKRAGIDVTLICDNMAASVMKRFEIDAVITGADRIAANGDTANKIGTYSLAVLGRYHRVPVYVAAPLSTFDPSMKSGAEIPIEERGRDEVCSFAGQTTAPRGVQAYNPAFDVTDAKLITGLITEAGILRSPYRQRIRSVLNKRNPNHAVLSS